MSLCGTLFIGVGYVELLFGLSGGVGYPQRMVAPESFVVQQIVTGASMLALGILSWVVFLALILTRREFLFGKKEFTTINH